MGLRTTLPMIALALGCVLFVGGCAEVTQIAGEISASQAYEDTYQKEYQQAKGRGLSDAEARAVAEQAAEGKAAKQRTLFAGVGDVVSSAGEIDYESERAIGESLALEGFARYGMPVADVGLQEYVNRVGHAVARNSARPGIPYRFVVVDSPLYNAFAAPGGIIFVSSTLVKSMGNEAELACVLAHEVGHVSHRHALKSIKRAKFFEGVGKISVGVMEGDKGAEFQSLIGDLQGVLFDKGLDKNMEFEADLAAMETAYRTGYDPAGMVRVLEMLRKNEASARKDGSWFSTHPPVGTRLRKTQEQLAEYPDAGSLATVKGRFARYRKRVP